MNTVMLIGMGFRNLIEKLPPSAFSFTMSTGIISISAIIHNASFASEILFYIGLSGILLLGFLLALKFILKPHNLGKSLFSNEGIFGFFTISAGIDVMSTRLMVSDFHQYDYVFFIFSMALMFLFLIVFMTLAIKRVVSIESRSVTSDWLNIPVALEASAISASVYYQGISYAPPFIYVTILSLVITGLLFYVFININETRNLMRSGTEREFSGLFFINMGAAAIFSLASFELLNVSSLFGTQDIQTLLSLFSLAGGLYATIWLPVVFIRFFVAVFRTREIRYRVSQWAIIFPLGMYSVTSHYLSEKYMFHGLFDILSYTAFFLALSAWIIECAIALNAISGLSEKMEKDNSRNEEIL